MPADCEICECGVLAVGRCAACGRAMCASHRKKMERDKCSECYEADIRARADALAEASERVARAREQVRAVAGRLVEARVRPDCLLHEGDRAQRRLVGGTKFVRDRGNDVYGWFVGEYLWWVPDGQAYDAGRVQRQVRTFVTSYGGIARAGIGLHSPEDLLSYNAPDFWEEMLSKMLELARKHGVA